MNINKSKFKKSHTVDYICDRCGFNCAKGGELFYLEPEIWYKITLKFWGVCTQKGILCIGCCEILLGRRLTKSDFTLSYVNKISNFNKSARLINRLMR